MTTLERHRAALAWQAGLAIYMQVVSWVPLGRWNYQPCCPTGWEQLRRGTLAVGDAFGAAAFLLPLLAFWWGSRWRHRWAMWLALVSYMVWLGVQLWTWWPPYLSGASERWSQVYERAFARSTPILPRWGNHLPPDAMHFVLQVLLLGVVASGCRALLRRTESEDQGHRRWAMGKSAGLVVLVGLLVGAGSARQAGTHEDARRLVARAIRAAGGEDRLARYGARTWKEKAVYHGADGDERYEASYSAEWPDKLRVDIGDFIMVLNGDKGWVKTQGETREMSREEMEEHREGTYSAWVLSLVPLGRADFRLSLLGQRLVDGRPADGIKISRQGHFDVNMYFDRDTGLLAMTETRFREARSGREVKSETVFSIYKEVSGIKTPTAVSITRDGRLAVEASIETTYVERLGERVFAKP